MLLILFILGTEDTELEFRIRVADGGPFRASVEIMHQLFGALEGPIDDVDVVDLGPAE